MQTSDTPVPILLAEGTVRQVDVINRELVLDAGGARVVFDVPPDCRIVLRGERVRLRVLQPRDRVRVGYAVRRGRPAARAIDVRAGR
ncbi:MAG TPA: hypothetical protein VGF55_24020 [Gemmataceae bacterium]